MIGAKRQGIGGLPGPAHRPQKKMQPLCVPGRFFSSPVNLALSLCTDGVNIFKSSPVGLWPVYLVILNLPARIRMKAENIADPSQTS